MAAEHLFRGLTRSLFTVTDPNDVDIRSLGECAGERLGQQVDTLTRIGVAHRQHDPVRGFETQALPQRCARSVSIALPAMAVGCKQPLRQLGYLGLPCRVEEGLQTFAYCVRGDDDALGHTGNVRQCRLQAVALDDTRQLVDHRHHGKTCITQRLHDAAADRRIGKHRAHAQLA